MALSNVIRGMGRGVASVGRAVQAASRKLDEMVVPQPAPMPPEMAAMAAAAPGADTPVVPLGGGQPGAPALGGDTPGEGGTASSPSRGFSLPSIGDPPNQADAKYAGEAGMKQYQMDLQDYEHKVDIHEAFADLDRIYSEAHPGRDFEKEYREEVAARKANDESRPRGSNLARAALALGDFNPAVRESGRSGLDEYNRRVDEAGKQHDDSFSERMLLRSRMHESAAAEAAQKGNWKRALAEREKLALLEADKSALEHQRKTALEETKQKGATERANIRRDSAENVARTRASAIGGAHGLSGNFLKTFEKEVAKSIAKFFGPKDLMKDYSMEDVEKVTDYIESVAEMLKDQQDGDGSSEKVFSVSPKKRTQAAPKPAEKEEF